MFTALTPCNFFSAIFWATYLPTRETHCRSKMDFSVRVELEIPISYFNNI